MLLLGLSLLLPFGLLLLHYWFALCIQSLYVVSNVPMFTLWEVIIYVPYLCPVYGIVEANPEFCCLHDCTSEFTLPKSFASSAKSFMHAIITSRSSFMYIRNNIGPNTLPCGIPRVIFAE